jgi:hypothetical protein
MIPVKLYQKMLDLEAELATNKSLENLVIANRYEDEIGWPWKASKEQLAYYSDWYKKIDPPIICDGCNVRHPFEHRCHRTHITILGERTKLNCQCNLCLNL